jgi:transcriptional regulator with XRE-family HTH domain
MTVSEKTSTLWRKVRLSLDLGQKEFAAKLGVGAGYVSEIESGKKEPSHTLAELFRYIYQEAASPKIKNLSHNEEADEMLWKSFVHKKCMPRVREKLQPVLSGEIDFYKCKYRLRNKENKYIWHLDTGRVTKRDDNGRAVLMEGQDVRIVP